MGKSSKVRAKRIGEKIIENTFLFCAVISVIIVFSIVAYLLKGGYPIIESWFLNGFGMKWLPDEDFFGVIPLIFLTFYMGIGCTVVATSIGCPCAIYLAEFATMKFRNILKPSLEVMTGIPSVIFGLIGAALVIKSIWLNTGQTTTGPGMLAVWIVVGIMSVPTVASISEDAIRAVPKDLKEASLGLGATRWQTMTRVTLPAAKSGILTSILLGMGKAMGETMAATMLVGGVLTPELSSDILHNTLLIPPIIVHASGGEAGPESLWFAALYAVSFLLFIIIAMLNLVIRLTTRKERNLGAA